MYIKKNLLLIVALFALGLGFFTFKYVHHEKKIDTSSFEGTILDRPRSINSFSLMGTDQKVFTNESLKGHWTMIFFGFTSCPSVCPTTMAELSKMYRILENDKVSNLPQVVMISVDPERDSLEKLANYVKTFHPNFYGARADKEVIDKLTSELGIAYSKIASGSNDDYTIEHTGTVMLLNPNGELSGFFTTPHHAASLAKEYALLVN